MPTIEHFVLRAQEINDFIHRLPAGALTAAACRGVDPDTYHPEVGRPPEEALSRCEGCPTAVACVALALRAEAPDMRIGWYGGLGPDDRSRLAAALGMGIRPADVPSERIRRAQELSANGWTINEIAVELSCSRRTVQRYLRQAA